MEKEDKEAEEANEKDDKDLHKSIFEKDDQDLHKSIFETKKEEKKSELATQEFLHPAFGTSQLPKDNLGTSADLQQCKEDHRTSDCEVDWGDKWAKPSSQVLDDTVAAYCSDDLVMIGESSSTTTSAEQTPDDLIMISVFPNSVKCGICLDEMKATDVTAHPAGCLDMFHKYCLIEWLKTADDGNIKCPVCEIFFTDIKSSLSMGESDDEESGPQGSLSEATTDRSDQPGIWFRQVYMPNLLQGEREGIKDTDKNLLEENRRSTLHKVLENCGNTIELKRDTVAEDMLQLYKEPHIPFSYISFTLSGEDAIDLDGIKREAYSMFWKGTLSNLFEGCKSYVPRVGPDLGESDYKALGLIISHGFVLTGMFPIVINKAFMVAAIIGNDALSESELLQCFLEYVSDFEALQLSSSLQEASSKEVFSKATQDFLIEFLSEFQVKEYPKPSTIRNIILRVAKTELIVKPGGPLECIRKGMQAGVYKELWSGCRKKDIFQLYEKLAVSPEAVAALIRVDEDGLTKPQHQVLTYLKKYVRSLNNDTLQLFMRYVTGSSMISVNEIKIIFHASVGSPSIAVHTCGAVIDLPSNGYTGFNDFRCQLDNLLHNPHAWKFTLV